MSYWQNTSPEFDARLIELSDLFLKCRDVFHELSDRYRWIPEPGSAAAADAEELASLDRLFALPRGGLGHRRIAEAVQTFLLTSSGHLGPLASLYSNSEVLFTPPLVIRAVIENCAHALWVLGDTPDEPADNRLARAYLEELLSAEEAKKNAGRMRTKMHPSFIHAEQEYRNLKREILSRFPDASRQEIGTPNRTLHGQILLGPEATVIWMYKYIKRIGGVIGEEAASGIYGFLSNMTHPTLYAARQRRDWVHDPDSGMSVANLHIEIGPVEREARAALAAFHTAIASTSLYFGWSATELDDLETQIDEVLPDFFR